MSRIVIQELLFLILLIGLSIPLGIYMYKVMSGGKVFLTRLLKPIENCFYRLMGIKAEEEMGAKRYAFSAILFSLASFLFLFLFLVH